MSAAWEARLASAVITSAFDDIAVKPPVDPGKTARRSKHLEWKRAWIAATEFLYTPECAPLRAFWFRVAGIPEPSTVEAMRRAFDRYVDRKTLATDPGEILEDAMEGEAA